MVAVAYADHAAAAVPPPETVRRPGAGAPVSDGVLLDTWGKDGGDLFDHMGEARLRAWVARRGPAGLLVALAGSLTA